MLYRSCLQMLGPCQWHDIHPFTRKILKNHACSELPPEKRSNPPVRGFITVALKHEKHHNLMRYKGVHLQHDLKKQKDFEDFVKSNPSSNLSIPGTLQLTTAWTFRIPTKISRKTGVRTGHWSRKEQTMKIHGKHYFYRFHHFYRFPGSIMFHSYQTSRDPKTLIHFTWCKLLKDQRLNHFQDCEFGEHHPHLMVKASTIPSESL